MKTNKQEREAIASKFHKRMEADMVTKNEGFKKTSLYKELSKLEAEKEALSVEQERQAAEAQFQKDEPLLASLGFGFCGALGGQSLSQSGVGVPGEPPFPYAIVFS